MKTNQHSEIIYDPDDLVDLLMKGHELNQLKGLLTEGVNLEDMVHVLDNVPAFVEYDRMCQEDLTTEAYDHRCQNTWFMPVEYKELDIAAHVLNLCETDAELQRAAEELLLYQERDLFNLLRYLKYLVDVMTQNNCIWGVGRGSSTASYVLYLLGVHRIDSMFYDLDPREFLR